MLQTIYPSTMLDVSLQEILLREPPWLASLYRAHRKRIISEIIRAPSVVQNTSVASKSGGNPF